MRINHLLEIKRLYEENTGNKPRFATVNPKDWELLVIELGGDAKAADTLTVANVEILKSDDIYIDNVLFE